MMAFKCDRCGKYFDMANGRIWRLRIYRQLAKIEDTYDYESQSKVSAKDLCSTCFESFEKWMENETSEEDRGYSPGVGGGVGMSNM